MPARNGVCAGAGVNPVHRAMPIAMARAEACIARRKNLAIIVSPPEYLFLGVGFRNFRVWTFVASVGVPRLVGARSMCLVPGNARGRSWIRMREKDRAPCRMPPPCGNSACSADTKSHNGCAQSRCRKRKIALTEDSIMPETARARPSKGRWYILGVICLMYLITYLDRVNISTAAPEIRKEFGFDLVTMGWIFSAFGWSYALFQVPGGWLSDRFGPRPVLAGIVTYWSAMTVATAASTGWVSFVVYRFLFGIGEAGAF